ncbi:MAG: TonB-dependent receptor [Bacteroidales bacterium]|nr:TonB-dependent receptor [Bacteroidales bacterium]
MLFSLLISAGLLAAAVPDTLQAVTVVADRGVVVSRSDTVFVKPYNDAASVLQMVPGLYVGDYGGVAGLKSVSLRGFGSAHTVIYVDGVRVGNVQSGQSDLGSIDFGSVGEAVVDYAQNSVSFNTVRPVFRDRNIAGRFKVGGGSFGTWLPYGRLDFKLAPDLALSAHASGIISDGAYPLVDGSKRTNNDIKQLQAGVDLFGRGWQAKIGFNGADRGTPGSLSWPSTDRQSDRNAFAQARLQHSFSKLYTLDISAKGAYDKLLYKSEWGDSDYAQSEVQLNSSHRFAIKPWWTVSLAADAVLDGLKSNMYNGSRIAAVGALASAFRTERLKADIAVEYSGTFDDAGAAWNSFSPSADLRFSILDGFDIVAFGRRAYRVPTFNELYYPGYGNPDLKPEDAWLADLGLDWRTSAGAWTLKARADGFYNYLTDKIVSAPSEADPMVWLPYNVGKVEAFGADVLASADYAAGDWKAGASVRYSWQKATDKTPDSYTFGQQVPYVAKHTVVLTAVIGWKGWRLEPVFNLRGGRCDGTGELPDWQTLDVTAGKDFNLPGNMVLSLNVIGRNLLDCRYDIVRDYPMPGRSFLAGLSFVF